MPPTPADAFDARSYAIIGAAMEVHRTLGPGFLESVYHDALAIEFGLRGIVFERDICLPVIYKTHRLGAPFRPDFLCFDDIIVELKAISQLSRADEAQIIHYLKAWSKYLGLLLNFGAPSLDYRRFVMNQAHPDSAAAQEPLKP